MVAAEEEDEEDRLRRRGATEAAWRNANNAQSLQALENRARVEGPGGAAAGAGGNNGDGGDDDDGSDGDGFHGADAMLKMAHVSVAAFAKQGRFEHDEGLASSSSDMEEGSDGNGKSGRRGSGGGSAGAGGDGSGGADGDGAGDGGGDGGDGGRRKSDGSRHQRRSISRKMSRNTPGSRAQRIGVASSSGIDAALSEWLEANDVTGAGKTARTGADDDNADDDGEKEQHAHDEEDQDGDDDDDDDFDEDDFDLDDFSDDDDDDDDRHGVGAGGSPHRRRDSRGHTKRWGGGPGVVSRRRSRALARMSKEEQLIAHQAATVMQKLWRGRCTRRLFLDATALSLEEHHRDADRKQIEAWLFTP